MDNYTGPYLSNGQLQSSVAFGDIEPLDYVDQQSRLHDSAYAAFESPQMRRASDEMYYDSLKDTPGTKAFVARNAVLFGNYLTDQVTSLIDIEQKASLFGPLGTLFGLAYWQAKNIISLDDRLVADPYAAEKDTLRAFYATDPHSSYQTMFDSGGHSVISSTPNMRFESRPIVDYYNPKLEPSTWAEQVFEQPQTSIAYYGDALFTIGSVLSGGILGKRGRRNRLSRK